MTYDSRHTYSRYVVVHIDWETSITSTCPYKLAMYIGDRLVCVVSWNASTSAWIKYCSTQYDNKGVVYDRCK
jgi:hypothetical protein